MWTTFSRRLVNLLAVLLALILCFHILQIKITFNAPKPSPVPPEQHAVLSPTTYKYVLNQPAACENRKPFLVLMVPVAPGDVASREVIRKTWGAPVPGVDTLTLFYVGLSKEGLNSYVQADLQRESREHADIIQMDFVDSYHNLTIKTMMIMNWLTTHCQGASYAMKVDADIFVNVFYLITLLDGRPRQDYITGSVIADGRPRRDSKSKWHLAKDLYPEDSFPPYVSGAGYVFSTDLAAKISKASRFVRMVPLEDVYVGLCLHVLGVRPVYSQSFLSLRNLFEVRRLDYERCTFALRVIVTGFTPSELLYIWQDFSRGHHSC
ncbi:beta-1,3-galactosyltransferase 2 [Lampris incognitus]|uniref:beta-1,3-galactosyltransferase 2 n=1 Tax=Lampris incognitus TaxID=2546036 RepID=UPI0024B5A044|nr:beta-1,3-galactosyltransferase 2 [Lampris incognitus]